jgi:hypothetical protein
MFYFDSICLNSAAISCAVGRRRQQLFSELPALLAFARALPTAYFRTWGAFGRSAPGGCMGGREVLAQADALAEHHTALITNRSFV